MQNIPIWECGDGFSRADAGSAQHSVVAKTADYTIKSTDVGKCFTNAGAAATVVLTLPTPKAGMWFKFAKIVQDQMLKIKAPAGVSINGGTAAQYYRNVTTETGYATLCLEAISATDYVVRSETGTWANAAS